MNIIKVLAMLLLIIILGCISSNDSTESSKRSDKTITEFTVTADNTEYKGTISDADISIVVPNGTDVTALVATFTTTGESVHVDGVNQTSGITENNFSNDVVYTVTAADGTTQDSTISVIITSTVSTHGLTAFSIIKDRTTYTGVITDNDILITVPYGTDITELVVTFETTGESVTIEGVTQESGTTANDFTCSSDTKYVTYTLTEEDGETQKYYVTVLIKVSNSELAELDPTSDNFYNLDTSSITDMSNLFYKYKTFNQDISGWDTSSVTDMSGLFYLCQTFNQDISGWDTSRVTDMSHMFGDATAFDGDISGWDTSKVINMKSMFRYATTFNQDISGWSTSNVTYMDFMFQDAAEFNQDISCWDTSSVTVMTFMFYSAVAFNQDLSDWDTSKVTDISSIFELATAFDGDISEWNTSKVVDMSYMFRKATAFNGDISRWDTSLVTDMKYMFSKAVAFNQDISTWDISSVESYYRFNRDGILEESYWPVFTFSDD